MNMDPAFDSMDPSFSPAKATLSTKATVPSCSDVVAGGAAGYLGPRGVSMYKTTFQTPADTDAPAAAAPVRLQFEAGLLTQPLVPPYSHHTTTIQPPYNRHAVYY